MSLTKFLEDYSHLSLDSKEDIETLAAAIATSFEPLVRKVVWYAGTQDIARMGPFKTQAEAWKSLRTTDGVIHVQGRVWCEEV